MRDIFEVHSYLRKKFSFGRVCLTNVYKICAMRELKKFIGTYICRISLGLSNYCTLTAFA